MDIGRWLTAWLRCHPLRDPSGVNPDRFTAEVMERVKAHRQLAPVASGIPWLSWPRPAFSALAAGVGLVVVLVLLTMGRRTSRLSEDKPPQDFPTPWQMAESAPTSDEQWIDETLQLLDQVDDAAETDVEEPSDEEWLEQLELLDGSELATNS